MTCLAWPLQACLGSRCLLSAEHTSLAPPQPLVSRSLPPAAASAGPTGSPAGNPPPAATVHSPATASASATPTSLNTLRTVSSAITPSQQQQQQQQNLHRSSLNRMWGAPGASGQRGGACAPPPCCAAPGVVLYLCSGVQLPAALLAAARDKAMGLLEVRRAMGARGGRCMLGRPLGAGAGAGT